MPQQNRQALKVVKRVLTPDIRPSSRLNLVTAEFIRTAIQDEEQSSSSFSLAFCQWLKE